ncbi:LysR family transcriptional regulator [Hyphomonas adhaerens MHS-3]|uniref:LysR family transcriptional regulator n=1 Tax=Hyphomonas adhaerens MHS-3 TaxID=1280949 RepID=A0A069E7Z5_9PROT|nr:LysR family transcriptional regulator [Hyphomonas adhaerens]KCZ86410.1 LysR family transcriptional regulator [Hyphomonas adhaerens MHS-3]
MQAELFDWDKIRVFRTVAQLGSMSAAAARLCGSVPTVSRRMSDLEADLNTQLFHRSTRGIELTEAGHVLLRHANVMADVMEAVQIDVADQKGTATGIVRLDADEALLAWWIAPQIAAFLTGNPGIDLRASAWTPPTPDIASISDVFLTLERPVQSDLITRRLGKVHYAVYAVPTHPVSASRPARLASIDSARCVFPRQLADLISGTLPAADSLRQFCERSPISNSLSAALAECRSGAALCALPTFVEAAHPDILRICPLPAVRADIWMSFPERARRQDRCVTVLDWLRGLLDAEDHHCFRQNPAQALQTEPETRLCRQA